MKKIQKLLISLLALMLFNFANALEIVDVKSDYWASQEIVNAIQNGYIYVIDGNKFKPEQTITRSEFVTALLKVIRRQNDPITQTSTFKDISSATPNKQSVVLSEQIRMAFGYPDNTFKPELAINHNETMSMIANITKGDYIASDITSFNDYQKIPIWARRAYIKNVANGLYVNHPNVKTFNPTRELTRAEAAVIFNKIASNIDKIKDNYRDLYNNLADDAPKKSIFIAENNLNTVPFALSTKVDIYDNKKVVENGNIVIGVVLSEVDARKDLVGQEYVFTTPEDVYTAQGTFLLPKGTEFYARVEKIGYSAWRSKAERSNVVFHKYSLPTGETYDMAGVPFTKDDKIIYVNSIKKPKQIKKLSEYKTSRKEYLIECAHQMSPLLDFNAKNGKKLYILLTGDMVLPQNEEYLNIRTKKSILEEQI